MKIRNGFVSNSSSSSFVVARSLLTEPEITVVLGYLTFWGQHPGADNWTIEINSDYIEGWTTMDNGDFRDYLGNNNVPTSKFRFFQD